jgi:hypothetical protein
LRGRYRNLILLENGERAREYRVLIVNDDELLSYVVGQMLRSMGYFSVVCDNRRMHLRLSRRSNDFIVFLFRHLGFGEADQGLVSNEQDGLSA